MVSDALDWGWYSWGDFHLIGGWYGLAVSSRSASECQGLFFFFFLKFSFIYTGYIEKYIYFKWIHLCNQHLVQERERCQHPEAPLMHPRPFTVLISDIIGPFCLVLSFEAKETQRMSSLMAYWALLLWDSFMCWKPRFYRAVPQSYWEADSSTLVLGLAQTKHSSIIFFWGCHKAGGGSPAGDQTQAIAVTTWGPLPAEPPGKPYSYYRSLFLLTLL